MGSMLRKGDIHSQILGGGGGGGEKGGKPIFREI